MLAVSIAEKGYITRINAIFLVASWPIFMLLARGAIGKSAEKKDVAVTPENGRLFYHFIVALLRFVGVAVGAYALVQSVIILSGALKISEYLISFFIVAIGTSLPELVVDLTALRKRQYELAIGDIIGSLLLMPVFPWELDSYSFRPLYPVNLLQLRVCMHYLALFWLYYRLR